MIKGVMKALKIPNSSPSNSKDNKVVYKIGDYKFVVNDNYILKKIIGKGAYGVVCCGLSKHDKTMVAIKRVKNVFDNDYNPPQDILREICLLKFFKHPNIISLKDLIVQHNYNFNEIYIVTDLYDTDLEYLLKRRVKFTVEQRRYIMFQLFLGLNHIHSSNVVHQDLKPANILIDNEMNIRICDFGISKSMDEILKQPNSKYTTYIVTRYYRAPELLFLTSKYDVSIDIWSLGCIMAELINGEPLFTGSNHVDQAKIILDNFGKPNLDDYKHITNVSARRFIEKFKYKNERIDFFKLCPGASYLEIDLLEKVLTFNPLKRWTSSQIIEHSYFKCFDDQYELCPQGNFEFDHEKITDAKARRRIWDMSLEFYNNYHCSTNDDSNEDFMEIDLS